MKLRSLVGSSLKRSLSRAYEGNVTIVPLFDLELVLMRYYKLSTAAIASDMKFTYVDGISP